MAIEIPSFPLNEVYYTAEEFQLYAANRSNGIYSDSQFKVTATSDQTLQVSISPGIVWIRYGEFNGIVAANKTTQTLTLSTAPTIFWRVDRIVIRYNVVSNQVEIAIRKGPALPSTINPYPALQRNASVYELAIADIRINAGNKSISSDNILDRRWDENYCGIMQEKISRIPTQTLFNSWESWFGDLKIDAENKAKIFMEWMESFKAANIDGFEEWIKEFKNKHLGLMRIWFDDSRFDFSSQFKTWFSDLQAALGEKRASLVFNEIDQHDRLSSSAEKVHGTRYIDGKFQIHDGVGWITVLVAQQGITAGYARDKQVTAMKLSILQLTANEFRNLIERG